MLACKETAVIHFFAIAVALLAARYRSAEPVWPGQMPARNCRSATGAPAKLFSPRSPFFIFTAILLFTWFGRNWSVFADLLRAIPSFAARAGGEGTKNRLGIIFICWTRCWSGLSRRLLGLCGDLRCVRASRRNGQCAAGDLRAGRFCDLLRHSLQNAVAGVEPLAAAGAALRFGVAAFWEQIKESSRR